MNLQQQMVFCGSCFFFVFVAQENAKNVFERHGQKCMSHDFVLLFLFLEVQLP